MKNNTQQFEMQFRRRLKRAAELLTVDSRKAADAAFEVGFSNANYFTRCFKQKFNCLPSQYTAARGA